MTTQAPQGAGQDPAYRPTHRLWAIYLGLCPAMVDERPRSRIERAQIALTDSMLGSIGKPAELAQLSDTAIETLADVGR